MGIDKHENYIIKYNAQSYDIYLGALRDLVREHENKTPKILDTFPRPKTDKNGVEIELIKSTKNRRNLRMYYKLLHFHTDVSKYPYFLVYFWMCLLETMRLWRHHNDVIY